MATQSKNAHQNTPSKASPALLGTKIIFFPFTMIRFVIVGGFLSILISVLIEWIGMTFFWSEELDHAYVMFEYEYQSLQQNFTTHLASFSPFEFISSIITTVYRWMFHSWPINTITEWLSSNEGSSFGNLIRSFLYYSHAYFEAAAYVIMTIVMRIVIFILSAPWFLICSLIGLVKGMVEREIRKEEGGLEHAFIHHTTKRYTKWVVIVTWFLYLGSPFAIHPTLILIPGGIVLGYAIYITAWSFKKFL